MRFADLLLPEVSGSVTEAVGLGVSVAGLALAVGDAVTISTPDGPLPAEVVSLRDGHAVCLPLGDLTGVRTGASVRTTGERLRVPVGDGLLGRVLDAFGHPIDGKGPLAGVDRVTSDGTAPHPMLRSRVDQPLSTGVRVLDTLTTLGRGQRIGLFAGSGVGKSSLLSMVARGTEADVSVLALIGERGREVREFVEDDLGPEGLARSVVIVATSDTSPLVRLQAAQTATRICEDLRSRGRHVLLMLDSLTRVALAQREVGLAAGEPPATRGYPPSTFALLPRLLERAGTDVRGSVTGIYTVLVEGDDHDEPVADAARSILDGHVVLTRDLAVKGHFPSVDAVASVSRVAGACTSDEQRALATAVRTLLAKANDAADLVSIGAHVPGADPLTDKALELAPAIDAVLRQERTESTSSVEAWRQLAAALDLPAPASPEALS